MFHTTQQNKTSEENFNETLRLVDRVRFSDIHPFPFSPRQGTVAYKMKDLPAEIKKQRLAVLLNKKEECKKTFANLMKGKVLDFLFEEQKDGYYQGYSENYLRIYLKDFAPDGNIKKVKVIEPFLDGALCELKGD